MAGRGLLEQMYGSFQALKASKWKLAAYLPLMVVLTTLLSAGTVIVCLVPILMILVLFGVPYWLGERRIRVMAGVGLLVILLSALLGAALMIAPAYSPPATLQSSPESEPVLYAGLVDPWVGDPDTVFTYTVSVQASADVSDVAVYVNITSIVGFDLRNDSSLMEAADASDTDLGNGKAYRLTTTLPSGRHFFYFAADVNGSWTDTTAFSSPLGVGVPTYGPINQPILSFLAEIAAIWLLQLLLVGSLFYLILLLYWWVRRGREVQEGRRRALGRFAGGFECTNCGADVPEDADFCPKCGALFEEEE